MNKAYPIFKKRQIESLNDLWQFSFFEGKSLEEVDLNAVKFEHKLPVPGAFDAFPDFLGKRGTGVYKRCVEIAPGTKGLLEFEAASFAAKIFVDGECLAEHFCGYSPFTVDVPPSDQEVREIVVLTENRFDFERIPMHEHFFDFYQFGGITRPVWLHHLSEEHIIFAHVDATDYQGGKFTVRGQVEGKGNVTLTLLEDNTVSATVNTDEEGLFTAELTIPNAKAWAPESPNLYRLKLEYGNDDMIARFGLREIKVEGDKLVLNGKPIRLFGYNRHEYFPNYGPSTPYPQMVADIQLLKDTGCNFVRGSHYPQEQRLLDLCDEAGLLFWEENLGWGQREKQLADPLYNKHHQASLEEMVYRSYNHPSIIIWGFLNEGASDREQFREIFNRTMGYLRENGGNRVLTYASNRPATDFFLDQVDMLCFNLYPGWYGAEDHPDPIGLVKPTLEEIYQSMKDQGLNKPFLVSEIGCEGLYGWRDQQRDFHSEEYQHDYLQEVCQTIMDDEKYLGVCLWHFSDARTYTGGRALMRPRAFNNKGTFDEYRRPKLARDPVKRIFRNRLDK